MLTQKQLLTYQFICQYIAKHGLAPTDAEIAKGIGIQSRGVVHRYVMALVDAKLVTVTPGRRRNIALVNHESESNDLNLPILGKIAAGRPIEAVQEPQYMDLKQMLLGPKRFILKVQGDSMVEDNICDGDFIICEHCQTAPNGAIVIALIDRQEATLKRLKRNADQTITLLPSNSHYQPMHYSADRVEIQGIYLGLFRIG